MQLTSGAIAEIDIAAICANYRILATQSAPSACAAVVKANAYGLGALPIAKALQGIGCRHFFVATLSEGAELRDALPNAIIYVLYGVANAQEASYANACKLIPCLNTLAQIDHWQALAKTQQAMLPACIHVDTGMNRLGLADSDVESLLSHPDSLKGVQVEWLMSHLACAATPAHPLNAQQLQRFATLKQQFPHYKTSFSNSSGIFMGQSYHGDLTRPGVALYGVNPTLEAPQNPMQTVVTLKAPILQIRDITHMQSVGYGATYQVKKGARLATVACGYADAVARTLSNRGKAYVAGSVVPIVGIVSMDLAVIDISDIDPNAIATGDMVEFFGKNISIDSVAEQADTIGYEVLTGISSRVQRLYLCGNKYA